jgi:hypothetical protein
MVKGNCPCVPKQRGAGQYDYYNDLNCASCLMYANCVNEGGCATNGSCESCMPRVPKSQVPRIDLIGQESSQMGGAGISAPWWMFEGKTPLRQINPILDGATYVNVAKNPYLNNL